MAPDRRKSSFTAALAGVALGLSLGVAPGALAQQIERSQQHDFRVRTLASGLEHPWSLAFLPGGGILITGRPGRLRLFKDGQLEADPIRSEEHTSELQSLMRISYAVFCLTKKKNK